MGGWGAWGSIQSHLVPSASPGPTSCYLKVSSIPPPLKGHREKGTIRQVSGEKALPSSRACEKIILKSVLKGIMIVVVVTTY